MILEALSISETGAVRSENQDAIFVARNESVGIFAVADGMGGHYKGGIASTIATDMLRDWWMQIQDSIMAIPFFDVVSSLEKVIRNANQMIRQEYQKIAQQGGTTLCMLLIQGSSYAIFNVGDSRAYYCDRKRFQQLSVDDVWENQPQIRSMAEHIDLKNDPRFGKLTNALGVYEIAPVSVSTGMLDKDGVFLLCSDGIYKYYAGKNFEGLLKKARKPANAPKVLEQIKNGVYENGAEDNLSAILVIVRNK